MKEKSANSSKTFEPEVVTENVKVEFTRREDSKGVAISGRVVKDDVEVGKISYSNKDTGYFMVDLKPVDALDKEEQKAFFSKIADWIEELK
ncbi:MAG: hypothetical protein ACI3ZK_07575 [Candidatus Cryptobacteroides sp.]